MLKPLMVLIVSCCFTLVAIAEGTLNDSLALESGFSKGIHYRVLEEPIANAPMMTEFTFFGCRACYQLVPLMSEWSKKGEHSIVMVPLHDERELINGAMLFHTFAEMGVLNKMYDLGYVIFQTEKTDLSGVDRINYYLDRHDIQQEQFWATWDSQAVADRLKGSLYLNKKVGVTVTPTFLIGGKYVVEADSVESVEMLTQLFDYLVALSIQ